MKQLSRSERVTLAIVAIAVLAGGVAPTVAPDQLGTAMMYDAAVLAATTFGLAGLLRLPPARRRDWWFVPAALVLFFAADVIWDIYEHAIGHPAPLPSLADAFYLAAFPVLLVGVVHLVRTRTDADRFNATVDVGTLAMAVGLLVWEPLLVGSGRSLVGSVVAGAYPVFDVVLFGFAVILIGARRPSQSTLLLVGGAGALFIADLTFLILDNAGRYATGGWPDPLFVIGTFLIAASPWFDVATDPDESVPRRRPRPVVSTAVVVASLVALPIDFGLNNSPSANSSEPVVRMLLRVVLLAFVAARLLRQAVRNESLVSDLDRTSTRLAMVIEHTGDAVVFTTPDALVLEWNFAAEELFGVPREEVLGQNILDFLVRPESAADVRDVMQELGGGGVREFTLNLELRGVPVAVTLQAAAVLDADRRVLGFVTIARDDTRRLLTRHALESFAQLEPRPALAKFAFELRAFVPFDVLSLATVDGETFRELARISSTGDAWDREVMAVDDDLLHEGALTECALEDYAPDVVESISLPLTDPLTGAVRGMLGLGFARAGAATTSYLDTLERIAPELSQSVNNMILYERERRTSERLQELDDLREGFFALVAHEVRSPLGAIGTAASVLRDHGATMDADAARQLAAGITTGARRLARLTGDLVDASKGGHGTFPCEMHAIDDLGPTIETAARSAAGAQRERVQISVEPGIGMNGDADRIGQIVTNLVTNALKFSGDAVDVCLRRDSDAAVVTVADHGPGIPASQEHRLFQRFTRLSTASNGPRPSGTGLGLFITRELVVAHGGTIRHYPTPRGGATFEVRIPCSAS